MSIKQSMKKYKIMTFLFRWRAWLRASHSLTFILCDRNDDSCSCSLWNLFSLGQICVKYTKD